MKKQQSGFTLIELLVVIAIIGLLSTLAVVSLNTARLKSRDTKRVADIKQVQSALEMFYSDNRSYPDFSTTGATTTLGVTANSMTLASGSVYMVKLPSDPSNGAYLYHAAAFPNTTYTLQYDLESGVANINTSGGLGIKGTATATPAGISN